MRFLIIALFFSLSGISNPDFAPKSFQFQEGKKAVFIDIIKTESEWKFTKKKIKIKTRVIFEVSESGYPLFDLVPEDIQKVVLNNEEVSQELILLPGGQDPMRVLSEEVDNGDGLFHELEVHHVIKMGEANPEFKVSRDKVNFFFKFCDGKGKRQLLERYIPSNLQFDQYPLTLNIIFDKSYSAQQVIANGEVIKINDHDYLIKYPEFYNSAAPFFHTLSNKEKLHTLNYKGVEVQYYYSKINKILEIKKEKFFLNSIKEIIDELFFDYGSLKHEKLIIYLGEKFSGIEHFGATRTSRYSLGHELFHMYFGRGVMPADGRSAWIDEGLARWRDGADWKTWIKDLFRTKPYKNYVELPSDFTGLGQQSEYLRRTWNPVTMLDPYHQGALFFGHVDSLMNGTFKDFLRVFHKDFFGKLYTQEIFFSELYEFICDEKKNEEIRKLVKSYF